MLLVPRSLCQALLGLLAPALSPVRVMQLLPNISQVRRAGETKKMKHVESKTRGQRLEPPLSLWIVSLFHCHCNLTGGRVMSHGVVLNPARARKGKNLRTPPVLTCQRRSVTLWQPPASLSARLSCGRGTNPLPATSHALGIRSGRHPRSRGGQVPNPEPRGAKPPHQVHHGGTAAESPNMGRFCHLRLFFPAAGPQDGGVGWGRHVR